MQPSSGARCLIFGRTLRLRPYFMCANSEGSGETARMRRIAWAFAGRLCDKYHNLMSWLKLNILCHMKPYLMKFISKMINSCNFFLWKMKLRDSISFPLSA